MRNIFMFKLNKRYQRFTVELQNLYQKKIKKAYNVYFHC